MGGGGRQLFQQGHRGSAERAERGHNNFTLGGVGLGSPGMASDFSGFTAKRLSGLWVVPGRDVPGRHVRERSHRLENTEVPQVFGVLLRVRWIRPHSGCSSPSLGQVV